MSVINIFVVNKLIKKIIKPAAFPPFPAEPNSGKPGLPPPPVRA